jgi:hypothetical protein
MQQARYVYSSDQFTVVQAVNRALRYIFGTVFSVSSQKLDTQINQFKYVTCSVKYRERNILGNRFSTPVTFSRIPIALFPFSSNLHSHEFRRNPFIPISTHTSTTSVPENMPTKRKTLIPPNVCDNLQTQPCVTRFS